jgi:hypothetical protein
MMKNILTLSLLLLPLTLFCQEENTGLVIIQDEQINNLVKKRSSNNTRIVSSEGYRLQLIYNTIKEEVNKERIKFIKKYPKIETYVQFDAPLYFLRVGDFKEKDDAEKFSKEIIKTYPENFIFKTSINLPFELEKKDSSDSENKKSSKVTNKSKKNSPKK